ncbi:MAG: hypothetical protein RI958_3332 [Actinomycetota bacterium]|jgi:hypothetical protein
MARDLLADIGTLDKLISQNRHHCAIAVAASGTA